MCVICYAYNAMVEFVYSTERVSLKNIGFIFDAENAEKITTNNSCLVNEYINEKWIDYVKTNFVKEIRRLFLQNSLSFLCEFNI